MDLWLVGSRYLRYRPISWISVLGVVCGMAVLYIIDSVMNGFISEQKRVIRGRTSDIIITPLVPELRDRVSKATFPSIANALREMKSVVGLAPRLVRPAVFRGSNVFPIDVLSSSQLGKLSILHIVGIEEEAERRVSDFTSYLEQPELANRVVDPSHPFAIDAARVPRESRHDANLIPVLIGERIYKQFYMQPYTVMKMTTYPEDPDPEKLEPISASFLIVGAFKTDDYKFDIASAFIPREAMKTFLATSTEAHEIAVALAPGADLDDTKRAIADRLEASDLSTLVETWQDRERTMLDAIYNERTILNFLLFFIIVIAAFLTFTTLWVMVNEKKRDIGILGSLGATPQHIAALFFGCGFLITTLGVGIGLVLGHLVTVNINVVRVFLEEKFGIYVFKPEVYVFTEIPAHIDLGRIGVFVASIFVVSLVASVVPAIRAAFFDPVRALRYE